VPAKDQGKVPTWLGRLLCRLGVHDYRLVECTLGFGAGGRVETVECRRCGYTTTRQGKSED
jgi:hypothetical protein